MLKDKILKPKQVQLLCWIVVFSLTSCKGKRVREESTKVVHEWIGKDTLPALCDEIFLKEFKILLYVDSAGCSDCRLNLDRQLLYTLK
jgi:hypothetical protein